MNNPPKDEKPKKIENINWNESIVERINPENGDWEEESQVSCVNKGYNKGLDDERAYRKALIEGIEGEIKETITDNTSSSKEVGIRTINYAQHINIASAITAKLNERLT